MKLKDYWGFLILFLCVGMPAIPAVAEEQEGMWVLKDIKYYPYSEEHSEAFDQEIILSGTSSSFYEYNRIDSCSNSYSTSWEELPKTLQPGSKVHISGRHVVEGDPKCFTNSRISISTIGPDNPWKYGMFDEGYSEKGSYEFEADIFVSSVPPNESPNVSYEIVINTDAGTAKYYYYYQLTAAIESTPCYRLKVSLEEADSYDDTCFLRTRVVELCSGDKQGLDGASLEFRIWDEENGDYRDLGPVTTDRSGEYHLEVPIGTWRVDAYASKEGYDEDWTNIYYCCGQGEGKAEESAIDKFGTEQSEGTDAAGPYGAKNPVARDGPSAPIGHGGLIFSDDFSDQVSGWSRASNNPDLSSMGYEKGKYHILQKKSGQAWSYPPGSPVLTDFAIEAEVIQEDGPDDNQYGLVLRRDSGGNYYCFQISGTGTYRFDKFLDGKWVEIIPATWSGAINTGNTKNVLGAKCNGEDFTFYLNGEEIDDARDSSIPSGRVGLVVGALKEPNVHISFDELMVWDLG